MNLSLFEQYKKFITQDLGESILPQIEALLNKEQQNTIRINTRKLPDFEATETMQAITGIANAYIVNNTTKFTADPLWHAGYYYVQESSSMVIGEIVKHLLPQHACSVLDMCAAPGGKSTHISNLLRPGDFLLANEVVNGRMQILYENLCKFGKPNFAVSSAHANQLCALDAHFDIIVCDAPCSGEGLFRKQNDSIKQWSIAAVEHCSLRQQQIVEQAWQCLKPGGFLIYSTCTINSLENEKNVAHFVKKHNATVFPAPKHLISDFIQLSEYGYRKPANASQGEPFFFAILQKPGELKTAANGKSHFKLHKIVPSAYSIQKEDIDYFIETESAILNSMSKLLSKVIYPGMHIGKEVHGKYNWNINAALLISPPAQWQSIELNDIEIIQFLKSEAYRHNHTEAYLWVTYKNHRVGMLKKAGNYYNNLWPKPWRILSNYITQAHCVIE